jgi:hypothetical protein
MKITTMETVAGRMNEEQLGSVRAVEYTSTSELAFGLNLAKEKIRNQAIEVGADAIVDMQLEIFEMSDGLFMAVASGLAMRTSALPIAMPIFNRAANDDEAFMRHPMIKRDAHIVSNLMH